MASFAGGGGVGRAQRPIIGTILKILAIECEGRITHTYIHMPVNTEAHTPYIFNEFQL